MSQAVYDSGGAHAAADGADRRQFERVGFRRQAWVIPLEKPEARFSVVTQDLSEAGVGFVSVQPFAPEARLMLCLDAGDGRRQKLLCRTRHCQEMGAGLYEVGAQFEAVEATTDDDHHVPAGWGIPAAMEQPEPVLSRDFVPDVFA